MRTTVGIAILLMLIGCTPSPAPEPAPHASPTGSTSPALPPASPTATPASASASATGSASASAAPSVSVSAAPTPVVADNQVKPLSDGEELQTRAKLLLKAIASDEPGMADPFWFPEAAFLPLKDITDPGKYWNQLHRAYANDIHVLHGKRKSWDGVTFTRFEMGSTPKWVKPGEEANKIGYYRSFHGKIHYEIGGEASSVDVHTVITWQGLWFVTHLSKFKK